MREPTDKEKEKIGDNLIWEGEDMDDEADEAWAKEIMEDVKKQLGDVLEPG